MNINNFQINIFIQINIKILNLQIILLRILRFNRNVNTR